MSRHCEDAAAVTVAAAALTQVSFKHETIPGFVSPREATMLCLPVLLVKFWSAIPSNMLLHFMQRLNIRISTCSTSQLTVLKANGIVPVDVMNCGLLRQCDAEVLWEALSVSTDKATATVAKPPIVVAPSLPSVSVMHQCFEEQNGKLYATLYTSTSALCIQCHTCSEWFSPPQFVIHVHMDRRGSNTNDRTEERSIGSTVHWGFNVNRWRDYLHLSCGENANSHDDVSPARLSWEMLTLDAIKRRFLKEDIEKHQIDLEYGCWTPCENRSLERKCKHKIQLPSVQRNIIDKVESNVVPFGGFFVDMKSSQPPPNVFLKRRNSTQIQQAQKRWIVTGSRTNLDKTEHDFSQISSDSDENEVITKEMPQCPPSAFSLQHPPESQDKTRTSPVTTVRHPQHCFLNGSESQPKARCVSLDIPKDPFQSEVVQMLHSIFALPVPSSSKVQLFHRFSRVCQAFKQHKSNNNAV